MQVVCRYCKTKIEKKEAYCITENGKNQYYCSEYHYIKDCENKQLADKLQKDKTIVYDLVCEIMGYKVQNSALWKEKSDWNQLKSDEIIAEYLEENKEYLHNTIANLTSKEYARIRYLSSILKNNLADYQPSKSKAVQQIKPSVGFDFYEPKSTPKTQRRSFAELEQEL